ncbi:hypothetical protein Oscil6304_3804 [Oscillatoria acuminata PCC 6304]|uniref:Uncharacterized protein n=1 Tax=Oscillatoria acuminata PCC 6304 TaxID=56110 RepID=K9TMK5_9CYAN|nr:hypothetical protein Oscil6304_3804 [Oscillatoria acuminata PCC 6304]
MKPILQKSFLHSILPVTPPQPSFRLWVPELSDYMTSAKIERQTISITFQEFAATDTHYRN